jgi:hypothetical protein
MFLLQNGLVPCACSALPLCYYVTPRCCWSWKRYPTVTDLPSDDGTLTVLIAQRLPVSSRLLYFCTPRLIFGSLPGYLVFGSSD